MFKKTVAVLLMATVLSTASLTVPRKAHAIVGLVTLNPVMTAVGATLLGVGLFTDLMGIGCWTRSCVGVVETFGTVAAIVGLVLLDDSNGRIMTFKELNAEDQKKLGISEDMANSFNSEVAQLNAVNENMVKELSAKKTVTRGEVKALWDNYRGYFSDDTIEVVKKIYQLNGQH